MEIENKEFIVLVGPSGCGKSTTLRMIAGLEDISQGELYIDGQLVNDVPSKDRDIAMVFQNYALYPHMSVFENMAFGLRMRKVPKDEIRKRVLEAARILDIDYLLDRKPKELSGGQRQRVALGRAIVRNPKVFLMDEPLSNLDAKLRVQTRTEISRLHKEMQTTFIYVTHDQTEAMTMGSKIVVMKDGIIQQIGNPQYIYDHPQNKFVAQFIGSPQMNVCTAKIEETNSGFILLFGNNKLEINKNAARHIKKEYIGKEVYLGIRPEDFHTSKEGLAKYNEAEVHAVIEVLEPLGCDTYVYMSIDGFPCNVVARLSPSCDVAVGERLPLAIDTRKVHFFDIDTEETILEC